MVDCDFASESEDKTILGAPSICPKTHTTILSFTTGTLSGVGMKPEEAVAQRPQENRSVLGAAKNS